MNRKCSYIIALLVAVTFSCNREEVIPGPVEKPDQPQVEAKYNDLGFTPHKDGDPFDSYEGLVMAGYQGWFGAPGDGCSHSKHENTKWYHYRENDVFKPGVLQNSIDFWPDVSEYEKTYETEFTLPNGEKAHVYSAYDESSVLLHFKWMKEYGIDGVFMQRFVGEVINNPDGADHFNKVLESAMKGSNQYQRAICVMYDLGGFSTTNNKDLVLKDISAIADKYKLFDRNAGQKYYLYQNGKPLVTLWGVGFSDKRAYTTAMVSELVDGLKELGFSVMLGVPAYWRSGGNDAETGTALKNLIKKVDVIMPWYVGRYDNSNFDSFKTNMIPSDISWCKTNKVGFAPMCYVGSSDRNMHPNNGVIGRFKGEFYWKQAFYDISQGAKMLYIAMFDEIDEGTAIYKCLNQKDVPSNVASSDYYVVYRGGNYYKRSTPVDVDESKGEWCTKVNDLDIGFVGIEDDLDTDYYLWLVGQSRAMLRGEIPLESSIPVRNK